MLPNIFSFLDAEFESGPHTGIPWQSGLKRGSALEPDGDSILVREEGFYFVYSQVGSLAVIPSFPHSGVLLVCLLIASQEGNTATYMAEKKKGCARSKHAAS